MDFFFFKLFLGEACSTTFFFFPLPNVAWKFCVITLFSKRKLFLKTQQSIIALGAG